MNGMESADQEHEFSLLYKRGSLDAIDHQYHGDSSLNFQQQRIIPIPRIHFDKMSNLLAQKGWPSSVMPCNPSHIPSHSLLWSTNGFHQEHHSSMMQVPSASFSTECLSDRQTSQLSGSLLPLITPFSVSFNQSWLPTTHEPNNKYLSAASQQLIPFSLGGIEATWVHENTSAGAACPHSYHSNQSNVDHHLGDGNLMFGVPCRDHNKNTLSSLSSSSSPSSLSPLSASCDREAAHNQDSCFSHSGNDASLQQVSESQLEKGIQKCISRGKAMLNGVIKGVREQTASSSSAPSSSSLQRTHCRPFTHLPKQPRCVRPLFGSVEVRFNGVCMLCGERMNNAQQSVVYCSRIACKRGMHVKCLLVCCSNSSSRPAITSQTGNCLPTHHVYRTDTEMCGLCHLFAYELSSLNSLQNGKTKQQPPEISGNNELPHSSDFDPDGNNVGRLIPTQQEVQIMAESLWHLRPNTSKTAEPLRATTTQMLRSLRVHVPTPKGVVVQAESYIWRVSAEAVKKRAKQMGLDGCSFRFSAAGFFEARLAAIVRFNQIACEAIAEGASGLEPFQYPQPDVTAWRTPCAQELQRIASIQRKYGWPESLPCSDQQNEDEPQSLEGIPEWILTRSDEDKAHIRYPPGPIFCILEGARNLATIGNSRKGGKKRLQQRQQFDEANIFHGVGDGSVEGNGLLNSSFSPSPSPHRTPSTAHDAGEALQLQLTGTPTVMLHRSESYPSSEGKQQNSLSPVYVQKKSLVASHQNCEHGHAAPELDINPDTTISSRSTFSSSQGSSLQQQLSGTQLHLVSFDFHHPIQKSKLDTRIPEMVSKDSNRMSPPHQPTCNSDLLPPSSHPPAPIDLRDTTLLPRQPSTASTGEHLNERCLYGPVHQSQLGMQDSPLLLHSSPQCSYQQLQSMECSRNSRDSSPTTFSCGSFQPTTPLSSTIASPYYETNQRPVCHLNILPPSFYSPQSTFAPVRLSLTSNPSSSTSLPTIPSLRPFGEGYLKNFSFQHVGLSLSPASCGFYSSDSTPRSHLSYCVSETSASTASSPSSVIATKKDSEKMKLSGNVESQKTEPGSMKDEEVTRHPSSDYNSCKENSTDGVFNFSCSKFDTLSTSFPSRLTVPKSHACGDLRLKHSSSLVTSEESDEGGRGAMNRNGLPILTVPLTDSIQQSLEDHDVCWDPVLLASLSSQQHPPALDNGENNRKSAPSIRASPRFVGFENELNPEDPKFGGKSASSNHALSIISGVANDFVISTTDHTKAEENEESHCSLELPLIGCLHSDPPSPSSRSIFVNQNNSSDFGSQLRSIIHPSFVSGDSQQKYQVSTTNVHPSGGVISCNEGMEVSGNHQNDDVRIDQLENKCSGDQFQKYSDGSSTTELTVDRNMGEGFIALGTHTHNNEKSEVSTQHLYPVSEMGRSPSKSERAKNQQRDGRGRFLPKSSLTINLEKNKRWKRTKNLLTKRQIEQNGDNVLSSDYLHPRTLDSGKSVHSNKPDIQFQNSLKHCSVSFLESTSVDSEKLLEQQHSCDKTSTGVLHDFVGRTALSDRKRRGAQISECAIANSTTEANSVGSSKRQCTGVCIEHFPEPPSNMSSVPSSSPRIPHHSTSSFNCRNAMLTDCSLSDEEFCANAYRHGNSIRVDSACTTTTTYHQTATFHSASRYFN